MKCLHSTFFPDWPNSVQTSTWQMTRRALLSTNFNTLHCHLQIQDSGFDTDLLNWEVCGSNPIRAELGGVFKLKKIFCRFQINFNYKNSIQVSLYNSSSKGYGLTPLSLAIFLYFSKSSLDFSSSFSHSPIIKAGDIAAAPDIQ